MLIKDLLVSAQKHAHQLLSVSKLSQTDRAKFSKQEIKTLIVDHVLFGRVNVCESILKSHRQNPYNSIDELIGDIQILLVESNDELLTSNPSHKIKVNLDDLIHGR